MTYSLLQGDDYIGPLATISGYGEVLEFAKNKARHWPELSQFFSKGYTEEPDRVAHQAAEAVASSPNRNVASILKNLHTALRGKKGRVYVGDV